MPRLAPQSRADRRTRILDAAKACFVQHGFHSASMQQICAAAGMSAGNLYRYFPSKDALIEGLCERDLSGAAEGFAAARRAHDVLGVLEAMLVEHLWERPRADLCIWTETSAEAMRSDAINRLNRHVYDFITKSVADVLAQGIANGTVRKGADAKACATVMQAFFDGIVQRRAVEPEFDPRRAIRSFMALIRASLAPAATPRRPKNGARK
ncbi:MAG: TetR/AcrR family transcriptional regulator [Rhodospirillales bacterium]|nr:TetR/AcrR family transcriptional regulator [Rhodospirillales bacterium]